MFGFQRGLKVVLCTVMAGGVAIASERPAPTPPTAAASVPAAKTASGVIDLALTPSGDLMGRYIDGEGRGIDGAMASLSRGNEIVAHTTTDKNGEYQFHGVQPGAYRLSIGNRTHLVRVWSKSIAPLGARPLLTTVHGDTVIRGQFGGGGMNLGVVFGIAGIAVGTVALVEAEEAKDDASELRSQMNTSNAPPPPASP